MQKHKSGRRRSKRWHVGANLAKKVGARKDSNIGRTMRMIKEPGERYGSFIHLKRVVSNPHVCGGEPTVKGTRIPVHVILSHLAARDDYQTILRNFPSLKSEDIQACLEYAAFISMEKAVPA